MFFLTVHLKNLTFSRFLVNPTCFYCLEELNGGEAVKKRKDTWLGKLNGCLLSFSVVRWQGQLKKPMKSFSVCQWAICSWAWESCDREWKLIWVLWPPGYSDHVAPLLNLFYMSSRTCMPNLVLLHDLSRFSWISTLTDRATMQISAFDSTKTSKINFY